MQKLAKDHCLWSSVNTDTSDTKWNEEIKEIKEMAITFWPSFIAPTASMYKSALA